jgi:hypothetical protein
MECFLKTVLDVLAHIAAPCIKAFREGGEKVRGLEARAKIAEKECLEWKERCLAAESRNQTQGKKLATAYTVIAVLILTVMLCMIFPQMRLLIGLVGLGVVFGSQLLPMTSNLEQYFSQGLPLSTTLWQSASLQIRPVLSHLVRFAERIRSRIRDWKWESVPASRSFNTAP